MNTGYKMLALDLDGTLFGPSGKISENNLKAVHRAHDSGLNIVICTSRSLAEAGQAVPVLSLTDEMIAVGGAMCVEPDTRRTLYRFVMNHDLVVEATELLVESGHRALLLKDAGKTGYDYLAVGDAPLHPATSWWFEHMDIRVVEVADIRDDPDPGDTVRLGIVTTPEGMKIIGDSIRKVLADRALVQHFPAVSKNADGGLDRTIEILEVFDPGVNKWQGISRLAEMKGISRDGIVAVGDEINDLEMIREAGLGIAMTNAAPAVKEAADRLTLSNTEDGVAYAIDKILRGEW